MQSVRVSAGALALLAALGCGSDRSVVTTPAAPGSGSPARSTADAVRQEALALDREDRAPLPLVATWEASTQWNWDSADAGFSPGWQLDRIDAGNHLLPSFALPPPETELTPQWEAYFAGALGRAGALELPIALLGTQWESVLYERAEMLGLPVEDNPNVVLADGRVLPKLSPFGPVRHWYEAGRAWGGSGIVRRLVELYPDPPLVLFVSNNESDKLRWTEVELDARWAAAHGATARDDDYRRRVVAEGWRERFSALQQGFREALPSAAWRAAARFVGYGAFGPGHFARWDGWREHSLYVRDRVDPHPLYWQGGSPAFYLDASSQVSDARVWSPQLEAMNWVFMQRETRRMNPSFWFEMSTWDGGPDKRRALGSYTPARYAGMVQFGLWLTRPRVIREYRDNGSRRADTLPWLEPLVDAVDRVHADPTLRELWQGSLVANDARPHPYQRGVPEEYRAAERMFLLSTDLDPPEPWSLDTTLPVFALARVLGAPGERRWLVYAHAPLGARRGVAITIPGYRALEVDVPVEGAFYVCDEATGAVTPVR